MWCHLNLWRQKGSAPFAPVVNSPNDQRSVIRSKQDNKLEGAPAFEKNDGKTKRWKETVDGKMRANSLISTHLAPLVNNTVNLWNYRMVHHSLCDQMLWSGFFPAHWQIKKCERIANQEHLWFVVQYVYPYIGHLNGHVSGKMVAKGGDGASQWNGSVSLCLWMFYVC